MELSKKVEECSRLPVRCPLCRGPLRTFVGSAIASATVYVKECDNGHVTVINTEMNQKMTVENWHQVEENIDPITELLAEPQNHTTCNVRKRSKRKPQRPKPKNKKREDAQ